MNHSYHLDEAMSSANRVLPCVPYIYILSLHKTISAQETTLQLLLRRDTQ